jgi:hypothetical protein
MTSSGIVQKLWSSACLVPFGADKYCNVMPGSLRAAQVKLPPCRALLSAGRRDEPWRFRESPMTLTIRFFGDDR